MEDQLKYIIRETLWMARRYADNRTTYAPYIFNECLDMAESLGVKIEDDIDIGKYARDGMLGSWIKDTQKFEKE